MPYILNTKICIQTASDNVIPKYTNTHYALCQHHLGYVLNPCNF